METTLLRFGLAAMKKSGSRGGKKNGRERVICKKRDMYVAHRAKASGTKVKCSYPRMAASKRFRKKKNCDLGGGGL